MKFPVSYSTAHPDEILNLLTLKENTSCFLLKRGFHDTYLLQYPSRKVIAKVYRNGYSAQLLEAQLHLIEKVNVHEKLFCAPIDEIIKKEFPEGERFIVFYEFAHGKRIRKPDNDHAFLLGKSIASIHVHSASLSGEFPSEISLASIRSELQTLSSRIERQSFEKILSLLDLIEEHTTGFKMDVICHGDIQPENFHFGPNGLSFFDLDFCGRSDRRFDLGSFLWYDHQSRTKEIMKNFYSGYSEILPLSEEEIRSVPWFSLFKAIHHMIRVALFFDGKQSTLWDSDEINQFVLKLERWRNEKCI